MTLGEKIASLRNSHKMSQGDLAEMLNVSRQSVSKWETGASVPELDKLIMMSNLFHISLDELVKGDSAFEEVPKETIEPQKTCIVQEKQRNTQHTIGFILLAAGLLGSIMGFVFQETLLLLSLCLIIYEIICLTIKKHTVIACGWFSTLLLFTPIYITKARITNIKAGFNIANIMICFFWILVIIMTVITIKTIIKNRKS